MHIERIRLNDDISDGQWDALPFVSSLGQWKWASVVLEWFTVAQDFDTRSDITGIMQERLWKKIIVLKSLKH